MEDPERLLGWALADNLDLMQHGLDLAAGSPCWVRRWQQVLQSMPTDSGTILWLAQLEDGAVMQRAKNAYASQCLQSPKFAYYIACIRGDLPLSHPGPHLSAVSTLFFLRGCSLHSGCGDS
jgi:hypothetical protein